MAQTYGAVVGYVSKITNGPLGYAARGSDGKTLGYFNSVGEAKRAVIPPSTGRMLTWTRNDLHGSIESYVATAGV